MNARRCEYAEVGANDPDSVAIWGPLPDGLVLKPPKIPIVIDSDSASDARPKGLVDRCGGVPLEPAGRGQAWWLVAALEE